MQLHKRMTKEQAGLVLDWYSRGLIDKKETLDRLGVKERRFYELLNKYRGRRFEIKFQRKNSHRRISPYLDRLVRVELEKEKALIADKRVPITNYNFTAIKDEVVKIARQEISAKTISRRAEEWGYLNPSRATKRKHDRVVLTTASGLLLQHDSSTHLWAPFANEKWVLITTIDDYSRYLLYTEFIKEESAWVHIEAIRKVALTYGVGSNYYVDNHSIFRFVRKTDHIWQSPRVDASTVMTQWKRTVHECGMGIIYALSPEAKGKVERPYRWLQDRIVRKCAKEEVKTIDDGRKILAEEVDRYNNHQVHSTTGEIPRILLNRSKNEGNSVFRPLVLKEPYTSAKDIFCIKEKRIVNGYGQISFRNRWIKVPSHVPERAEVTVHIYPDSIKPEVRLWYKDTLIQVIVLRQEPLKG